MSGRIEPRAGAGQRAYAIAAILSAGCFAAACIVAGTWLLLVVPLAAGILWLVPGLKDRGQSIAFAGVVFGCAAGVLAGLSPLLLLGSTVAALAAWDLGAVVRKGHGVADPESARRVERAHLKRLLVLAGAGSALGAAALLLRIRLGFAVLLGLGALLAAGLTLFLRGLRGPADRGSATRASTDR